MKVKKYNRELFVSRVKNKIDIDLLNTRLKVLFTSCGMQMSIFNSIFSESHNQEEYKNLVRDYTKSKKDYKKISRVKYK